MSKLANTHKVTFAALAVAMAVALVFAIAPEFVTSASAKIVCTSPGGGHPQSPNCQGAPQNENPSGKAPPGQNK